LAAAVVVLVVAAAVLVTELPLYNSASSKRSVGGRLPAIDGETERWSGRLDSADDRESREAPPPPLPVGAQSTR